MSKKGGSNHFVRMRASKSLGVVARKKVKWLLCPSPGPHRKSESVSAGVLMRDVLCKVNTIHEAKKVLNSGNLLVDGRKINDPKFAIGLMDIVAMPAEKKAYRMSLDGSSLVPKEISGEGAGRKYLKVTGKHTLRKGKTCISFHDGRNHSLDLQVKTGDTCVFSVPDFKMLSHIKLAPGVRCLVVKGKHMGDIANLDKIIQRPGSHDTEVQLSGAQGQFVTVAKYLFALDANYN